jgi:hypothetical protein
MSGTSTIACSYPQFAANPLIPTKPNLRFLDGAPDGAAGTEKDKEKDKSGGEQQQGGSTTFTAPKDQAELDRIIGERLAREREKFKDFGKLEADSKELARIKTERMTADEKAVNDAREEGRTEVRSVLGQERARFALERALEGRIPDASALLDLDRSALVSGDQANLDAIKIWVAENSKEAPKSSQQRDPSQGHRDSTAGTGSVQSGREAFESRHKKTS